MLEHTLEVEDDLGRFAGERADEVAELLAEPLADEMSRGTALRFGALFHDIGKPATRAERDGFVGFRGHDRVGAEIVGGICGRLRASRRLTQHLRGLTLHHLRLGFLVPEAPLPPRRVHEYLRATEPVAVDVTLLTVADRLSARGAGRSPPRRWSRRTSPSPARCSPPRSTGAATARRRRCCAATSSRRSWGSARGRSSASCWPSWRPPSTRAR